jgi:hypothetical protein
MQVQEPADTLALVLISNSCHTMPQHTCEMSLIKTSEAMLWKPCLRCVFFFRFVRLVQPLRWFSEALPGCACPEEERTPPMPQVSKEDRLPNGKGGYGIAGRISGKCQSVLGKMEDIRLIVPDAAPRNPKANEYLQTSSPLLLFSKCVPHQVTSEVISHFVPRFRTNCTIFTVICAD